MRDFLNKLQKQTLDFFAKSPLAFDLYFLITKKHLQVKDLLSGAKKKFGFKAPEDSFWSESMKALQKLNDIKPFIIGKTEKEKDALIKTIQDFFARRSNYFLRQFLK